MVHAEMLIRAEAKLAASEAECGRLREALTPASGRYPSFTRSTGKRDQFPQPADCGSQADRPYEIEPDKGGIAGHALARLFAATGEGRYLAQALDRGNALFGQLDGDVE